MGVHALTLTPLPLLHAHVQYLYSYIRVFIITLYCMYLGHVVSWLVNVAVSELMNITRAGRCSPIRREVSNAYVCVLRARAR